MISRKTRGILMVCGMAVALLNQPSESKALCDWLFHHRTTATTTYAAPVMGQPLAVVPRYNVAPAVAALPVTTTACYVPQTCFRTVTRPVTTTAYSPVTTCDPCTGCPVTAYRPITTITQQTLMVPYTSYRIVYSNPCTTCASPLTTCAPSGCGTCGIAGSPIIGSSSGCSSCTVSPAPSTLSPMPMSPGVSSGSMGAPTLPGPVTNPAPASPTSPATPGPVNPPSGGTGQPQTFKNTSGPTTNATPTQRPASVPEGRTASTLVRHASYSQEPSASPVRPSTQYRVGIDDWQPSDHHVR